MSDRRLSEGPELRATITDQPNIAPVAEIFIAEAGLSDRVSTLARWRRCPASLPLQRRSGKIDDGGSATGNDRGPLRHAGQSMNPGAFSSLKRSRRFARIATAVVGATATAEVGTLRLCWLRISPTPRGTAKGAPANTTCPNGHRINRDIYIGRMASGYHVRAIGGFGD